jgi:hypothetical protein
MPSNFLAIPAELRLLVYAHLQISLTILRNHIHGSDFALDPSNSHFYITMMSREREQGNHHVD